MIYLDTLGVRVRSLQDIEGVAEMTQEAFVDSLVDRFGIQYETQTPASVEFDLGPNTIYEEKSNWPYKQAVGGLS